MTWTLAQLPAGKLRCRTLALDPVLPQLTNSVRLSEPITLTTFALLLTKQAQ
jgi:hypothetical protein